MNILAHFDKEQLLAELDSLARIGGNATGGLDRVAYNLADRQARIWLESLMVATGMTVQTDAAGNSLGRYPGKNWELAPIALGSHTDTVPNGGRFDGSLGLLAALACVRALRAAKVQLRHTVEVINFAAEEATMSGGTIGSRAMAGLLTETALSQLAWDGRPVVDHLREAGLDPTIVISSCRRPAGSMAAFLELHIEQGGHLDTADIPIGVVEGIVGIRRYAVTFQGYADHAGTTPMANRKDALVMAAPFILAVSKTAQTHAIVGTVGTLQLEPGAPNVIPGRVELSVELRGLQESVLDDAESELAQLAQQAGADFRTTARKAPVVSDPQLIAALTSACDDLELPYRLMPSGAGHDAMCIAEIAPQAMLFVPSRDGISHSPDEFTSAEYCVYGAQVLLAALLKLDALLDPAA